MAADHDQVRWPVLCSIDDLSEWGTDLNECKSGQLLREPLAKAVDQLSRVFLGRSDQYSGLNTGIGGVYERGVNDMDECQLRPCEARQPCTDIGRMCRYWFSVDSNENLPED